MHIVIAMENGKLTMNHLCCDCSMDHTLPRMDIFMRQGLINACGDCIAKAGLGKKVLVVADANTYKAAAAAVLDDLRLKGFQCTLCLLPGEHVTPDQSMVDIILSQLKSDTDFLLAVGSGVITDLTRRSAFLAGLPFAVFGTAPSMDGFTSVTSSMVEDGLKISRYGNAARLLMFDTDILSASPVLMRASGIGDLMAKYNVLVDWKLGSAVVHEQFCPLCACLLETSLKLFSMNQNEIHLGTPAGMEALIKALIIAGMTVQIIGNTRAVASVEHNIAHYFEMIALSTGKHVPSHGICAGIGLIYALRFHEALQTADLRSLDKKSIYDMRLSKNEKRRFLLEGYPNRTGEEIMRLNPDWYISKTEQDRRIKALISYHDLYRLDCAVLPASENAKSYLSRFDAPVTAKEAGLGKDILKNALLVTKDFRRRYDIAKALDELGLLERVVEGILDTE